MKLIFTKLQLLITFMFIVVQVNSQDIVVSEYYNSGTPSAEWTELVVVKDKLDLRGYTIRDNSELESWQVPAVFGNHTVWSGLRSGTIIVIWHRAPGNLQEDLDPHDGYIETAFAMGSAMNSPYFTSPDPTAFEFTSFSLNHIHDMIQIRDPAGNNVHTLGHMTAESAVFASISGPKLAFPDVCVASAANKVVPGRFISDYSGGFDVSESKTKAETFYITKGTANNSTNSQNQNQFFWRSLRQPEFKVSNFTASLAADGVLLTWDETTGDDLDYQGYLIVRAPEGKLNEFVPEDGKNYPQGITIDNTEITIVARLEKLSTTSHIESYVKLNCDKGYVYRIFAYRYNPSDFDPQIIDEKKPEFGRGRSYNEEDHEETVVIIAESPDPPVLSIEGPTTFCEGGDAVITSNLISDDDLSSFIWIVKGTEYKGPNDIKGITLKELEGNEDGYITVQLEIFNINGCNAYSNIIQLNVIPYPDITIADQDFNYYNNDTTITICKSDELRFSVQGIPEESDSETQWYINGAGASSTIFQTVDREGTYFARTTNQGLCSTKSPKITVKFKDSNFDVLPTKLFYYIPGPDQKNVQITNNSSSVLIFTEDDIVINGLFDLVTGTPIIIQPKDSIPVTVQFTASSPGIYSGDITFVGNCDVQKTVELEGNIEDTDVTYLTSNRYTIDFGYLLYCDSNRDSTITLTIHGEKEVSIPAPKFKRSVADYKVTAPIDFPHVFQGEGNTLDVTIEFIANSDGLYLDTLVIDYTKNGIPAEEPLEIYLRAHVVTPFLEIIDDEFEFDILSCEDHIDTVMRVYNAGPFDIVIKDDIPTPKFDFLVLPFTIEPGDTIKVPIRLFVGVYSPNFLYTPCTQNTNGIFVNGTNTGAEPTLSADNINYGVINNCEEPGEVTKSFNIISDTDGMTIESIEGLVSGAFSTNLGVGGLSVGSSDVSITLDAITDGIYVDSLVINMQPCDVRLVVYVTAQRYTPIEPSFSIKTLDFGTYVVGNPERTRTFEITNNDSEELRITSFNGNNLPYILVSPKLSEFPIRIAPDSSITVTFSFQTSQEGTFLDTVNVNFDSPCDFDTKISLQGNSSIIIPPGTIFASLPNDLKGEPGTNVLVPISWEGADGFELNTADIGRVEAYISYDPSVLYPFTAYPSTDVSGITTNIDKGEYGVGKAKISYDVTDGNGFNPQYLGVFECKILLGSSLNTMLEIDSINFVSSTTEILVETEDGLLTVHGICEIETRLLTVGGEVALSALETANNSISIDFSVVTQDRTSIKIFDGLGNLVAEPVNGSLLEGEYTAHFPTDGMSSGVYHIIMQSGNFVKSKKIAIIK